MTSWSGKSRGGKFGYRFFIFLLKKTNIRIVYFFLRFVALYFLVASDKKSIRYYFREIHAYSRFKTLISIYKNYCMLGQVLIDKISVLSGLRTNFSFDFEGEQFLRDMVAQNKGGLLVGAHIGNWEVAGQLLERLDTKVNIVMYQAEHEQIKTLLEDKEVVNGANIIAIQQDFSHLFKIKEAFENNELVVMHGDRFLEGTNSIEMKFLDHQALFPTGPLYLASKHNTPVSYVYAVKETAKHYHFFATEPKAYAYPARLKTRKQDLEKMVKDYVHSLEQIVKKYPLQWFNYYPFWKEEKTKH